MPPHLHDTAFRTRLSNDAPISNCLEAAAARRARADVPIVNAARWGLGRLYPSLVAFTRRGCRAAAGRKATRLGHTGRGGAALLLPWCINVSPGGAGEADGVLVSLGILAELALDLNSLRRGDMMRRPVPRCIPHRPSRTSDGPQASYQITTINRPLKLRRRSRRPGSAPGMAGQIVPRCCGGLIECGEGCDLNFEGRPASAKLGDCGMRSDLAYHKCQLAYMINMALGLELGRVLRMGWM
ncbi:hypothetical protein C8Q72DRAFT_794396 [Fomitopsis betulina]|nr:hypothetical protein C8Q72DRAFT_794396 [Fomitopsis betulina]